MRNIVSGGNTTVKGLEFWTAWYFECLKPVGNLSDALVHLKRLAEDLNNLGLRDQILTEINGIDFINCLPRKVNSQLVEFDVARPTIKVQEEAKYLIVPEYTSKVGVGVRVRINPCLLEGTCTKLYSNFSYRGPVAENNIGDWLAKGEIINNAVLSIVEKAYCNAIYLSDHIKCLPYRLTSAAFGHETAETKNYLDAVAENNEKNGEHVEFLKHYVGLLHNHFFKNEPYHSKAYDWGIYTDHKSKNKGRGFLGFKGDRSQGVFIGFSDTYPDDGLRAANISVIYADSETKRLNR